MLPLRPRLGRTLARVSITSSRAFGCPISLYDLESLPALKPSPELDAAVNTPWGDRIRPHFQSIIRGTYLAYPATQSAGVRGSQAQLAP